VKFLVDEQLPPALVRRLRKLGHEAEHSRDAGLAGRPDEDIGAYAKRAGAVLFTKDEDFVAIGQAAPIQVVWIRLGNVTNDELWRALSPILPEILQGLERGDRLIEII
jgi:predicted nuclease of predicted toxin-antitoxin system